MKTPLRLAIFALSICTAGSALADDIRRVGNYGDKSAVLISGRFRDTNGSRRCRDWVGFKSTTSYINDVGNWNPNALFDGCNSEVAVFSENGAAQLIKPESRWTNGAGDVLPYSAFPEISVPTTVWVMTSYAGRTSLIHDRVRDGFSLANDIYSTSKCGVDLDLRAINDRLGELENPDNKVSCNKLKGYIADGTVSHHPNRMNVYVVRDVGPGRLIGAACININSILIERTTVQTPSLAHEYGHHFDLWHTGSAVNPDNIMKSGGARNMVTAGQCYRVNFSKDSYINERGLRSGKKKNCVHSAHADGQCPGNKNEF